VFKASRDDLLDANCRHSSRIGLGCSLLEECGGAAESSAWRAAAAASACSCSALGDRWLTSALVVMGEGHYRTGAGEPARRPRSCLPGPRSHESAPTFASPHDRGAERRFQPDQASASPRARRAEAGALWRRSSWTGRSDSGARTAPCRSARRPTAARRTFIGAMRSTRTVTAYVKDDLAISSALWRV
jgi:hypothetical protein